MKNFLRRLKFYGLGFGIGLIFVFFFFRNRGCSWLPENRVKNTILGRVLVVNDAQLPLFDRKKITRNDLIQFLNDGDVDFGKSKKQGDPQVYSVTKVVRGKVVELWFTLPRNSYISEIINPTGSIQNAQNSAKGMGKMIHFPNVENMVYVDENPAFTQQRNELKIKSAKQLLACLKKSGTIDFEQSILKGDLPEHYIRFVGPTGQIIEAKTTWYQEHIQFYNFLFLKGSAN